MLFSKEKVVKIFLDFISIIRFKSFDTTSEDGRSKERYRLIALSSSTNIIVKATTSLLGLITVPLTVNYLGKELFGLWMVLSSLVAWMQLSDFGIANGLINALSEAYGKDDKAAASSYIVTALISLIVIAIVATSVLYGVYPEIYGYPPLFLFIMIIILVAVR